LLEVVVLALPAVPTGLALAWLASVLLARRFYGGLVPWLPPMQPGAAEAAALGLGVAIGAVATQAYVASRRKLLEVRREASRPALRGWWQRRALDLGLAVVSLLLLAAARLLGRSDVRAHGASSGDPSGPTAVGSGFQPSILAVDPYSFRPVVWSRPDLAFNPAMG